MKLFLLFSTCFFIFSCTTEYQYLTVSSDQAVKNNKNELVVENDTLRITYRFTGENGPLQISIYNKTELPLEIDWRKSALVFREQATGFYSPNLSLNGTVQQDSLRRLYGPSTYLAELKADILVNEPSQFIPPKAAISKIPMKLPLQYLPAPALKNQQKQTISNKTADNVWNVSYRKADFDQSISPATFRSYLSFKYGGQAGQEFAIDRSFYISEIRESRDDPYEFPASFRDKGDVFYVSRVK